MGWINRRRFERPSAWKVSAAMIDQWDEFIRRRGKWHQIFEAVFDGHKQPGKNELIFIAWESFSQGCNQQHKWRLDTKIWSTP